MSDWLSPAQTEQPWNEPQLPGLSLIYEEPSRARWDSALLSGALSPAVTPRRIGSVGRPRDSIHRPWAKFGHYLMTLLPKRSFVCGDRLLLLAQDSRRSPSAFQLVRQPTQARARIAVQKFTRRSCNSHCSPPFLRQTTKVTCAISLSNREHQRTEARKIIVSPRSLDIQVPQRPVSLTARPPHAGDSKSGRPNAAARDNAR